MIFVCNRLNSNEFLVRNFEITRYGLSALIVPVRSEQPFMFVLEPLHLYAFHQISDMELEPEFLFADRAALALGHHELRDQRIVILKLSNRDPLHPCLSRFFEESQDHDLDQDASALEVRETKVEVVGLEHQCPDEGRNSFI